MLGVLLCMKNQQYDGNGKKHYGTEWGRGSGSEVEYLLGTWKVLASQNAQIGGNEKDLFLRPWRASAHLSEQY